ncbi:hypothetical protein [Actinoallomurus acanthiterrae]
MEYPSHPATTLRKLSNSIAGPRLHRHNHRQDFLARRRETRPHEEYRPRDRTVNEGRLGEIEGIDLTLRFLAGTDGVESWS